MTDAAEEPALSQSKKFEAAARDLECDDDPKRFDGRLGRIVKHRPVDKAPSKP